MKSARRPGRCRIILAHRPRAPRSRTQARSRSSRSPSVCGPFTAGCGWAPVARPDNPSVQPRVLHGSCLKILADGRGTDLPRFRRRRFEKAMKDSRAMYTAKSFDHLRGLSGISDAQITEHLDLYAGYVKQVNSLVQELSQMRADRGEASK